MEENTQPCDTCGGINFELVFGFYHCSECQTRRQDIQELEEDEHDQKLQGILSTKTAIKQETKILEKVKLTTWECYNYVIKGMTEELLILGADLLLRSVVKKLWFKYLLKLEVINSEKPKLQAVNTKIDAEIVYGINRKRKKKRKSCKSSNADLSSFGSVSSMREYSKKKRLLFNSQHDYSLSKSVDNSILDETVESLKNQSQKSSHSSFPLKFNKYAKKELRRRQSKRHLKKHSEDFENNLSCHRNSYSEASKKYQNSSHLLSINKIYSILYLGLLLTKSKIQLADMLRFIREGHLSFNSFKHFFPEEVSDNFLTQTAPRKSCLTSASLRESTLHMAKFLDVLAYLEVQNLALLIERFCSELNLPRIIEIRALNSLVITLPKMKIDENTKVIPNYEGRALSFILFQLKVFFSIDGKTEKYLSENASTLNNADMELNMFDFMKWLQYIDYRKHALKTNHFPTEFSENKKFKNSGAFVKFLINKNPEYEKDDIDNKTSVKGQDCRQLLIKLKDRQSNIEDAIYFKPSFTPSKDYVKTLLDDYCIHGEEEKNILKRSFQDCNLDFILNPSKYINLLGKGKKVEIKLGGINENIKQHKLINMDTERSKKLREDRKFSVVQLRTTQKQTLEKKKSSSNLTTTKDDYIKKFQEYHRFSLRSEEIENQLGFSGGKSGKKKYVHLVPYECYWVNTHFNLGLLSKDTFEEHLGTYPYNFQFVLKEMARIGEQTEQELLEEFTLTEIYLLYGESYQTIGNDNIDTIHNDVLMKKIVSKAVNHW
ncbi:TATA box-binding protein-associated factor RNA polymerase I subunit B [Coccinella septempunctata]|uniref:TATA box-binding protein-associated factor RNA polymerase I subunit B n=1 Tax=Coccinella septempunctata TaxID=41139 RepID=UPI001D07B7A7|nr:TATA box-binding protein-associated factor RNA polymerase I subunit B [Coccinella septempunctata]